MEKETGTPGDERALSTPSLIHSIHSTIFIEHLPHAEQCLQACGCSRERQGVVYILPEEKRQEAGDKSLNTMITDCANLGKEGGRQEHRFS